MSSDSLEKAVGRIEGIIGGVAVIAIFVSFGPTVLTEIFTTDTSNWSPAAGLLWGAIGMLLIFAAMVIRVALAKKW